MTLTLTLSWGTRLHTRTEASSQRDLQRRTLVRLRQLCCRLGASRSRLANADDGVGDL